MKKEELLKLIPELDKEAAAKVEKATEDEIATGYVPLARFNEVNTAKKKAEDDVAARDRQLETLGESTGDVANLQKLITDLQNQNAADKANYEAKLQKLQDERQVENLLRDANAINVKATIGLLTDLIESGERDENGNLKGIEDKVQELVAGEDTAFLFKVKGELKPPAFKGVKLGESGDGIPDDKNQPPKTLEEAVKRGLEEQQKKETE